MQDTTPLTGRHQALYQGPTRLDDAPLDTYHAVAGILLDDLAQGQVRPRDQRRSAGLSRAQRGAKHPAEGLDIGHQAVKTNQKRSPQGAGRDLPSPKSQVPTADFRLGTFDLGHITGLAQVIA